MSDTVSGSAGGRRHGGGRRRSTPRALLARTRWRRERSSRRTEPASGIPRLAGAARICCSRPGARARRTRRPLRRLRRGAGQRNISTWAIDLRGHGRSGGRRGHLPSFDRSCRIPSCSVARLKGAGRPAIPLFLFGHSMGGLIAVRYLQEYAPVLWRHHRSPWLATAMPVPRWKARGRRAAPRPAGTAHQARNELRPPEPRRRRRPGV
jgi:alpha-beta hydrolase superfamily lysophospholipase